jgi:lipid-A-disaccharide synthase
MGPKLNIMVVAGEASGDLHAAKLVRALRESAPDTEIEFFGCAGPRMRDAGVEPVVEADSLSIVGLIEIGRALPVFLKAFGRLKRAAKERRPDVAILVDFPDFNLKLAKTLKRSGTRVVYYISPQLWAWRKYRLRTVRKHVDLLLAILPFEKDWYAENGIDHVHYVGSPLAKEVHWNVEKPEFCRKHGFDPDGPIVSLLPGSRHKEISRIFPVMLECALRLSGQLPDIQCGVPRGSKHTADEARSILSNFSASLNDAKLTAVVIENETYDAVHASDAAAVTSGTATLETGIIGTPMAIVYKTSPINYMLLRPLITVDHFGLINLIAGRRVASELIQDEFTPETLADEMLRLLSPEVNRLVRAELQTASDKLGHGGASTRAALAILDLIDHPAA